jgi:hypothetical protein
MARDGRLALPLARIASRCRCRPTTSLKLLKYLVSSSNRRPQYRHSRLATLGRSFVP